MKKKRATGSGSQTEWQEQLECFLSSPLAMNASKGLSEKATIALNVEGLLFVFRRKKSQNTLTRVNESESKSPADVHFWVPVSTMRHLLELGELPSTGIGTMGVAIFEHMFLKNEGTKIKFRVESGFLGLWSKGYFSVLKAGGPEVASYLARFGFDSLSRVKEILKKVRS